MLRIIRPLPKDKTKAPILSHGQEFNLHLRIVEEYKKGKVWLNLSAVDNWKKEGQKFRQVESVRRVKDVLTQLLLLMCLMAS